MAYRKQGVISRYGAHHGAQRRGEEQRMASACDVEAESGNVACSAHDIARK